MRTNHVDNICNLSKIDGENVKFITTDNFGFTQTLKNTGDIILLRDKDRHDIYVAGEHIAGGYGFDGDENLNTLTTIANSYYSYIQYLGSKINVIKDIVDSYEDPVQPVVSDDYYIYTIGINDTAYTITTNNSGRPCFVADKDLSLEQLELTPSEQCRQHIITYDATTYIMEDGVPFKLSPSLSIHFNAYGTTPIATLDAFASTYVTTYASLMSGWNYTYYPITCDNFNNIVIDDENYPIIGEQTISEKLELPYTSKKDSISIVINDAAHYDPHNVNKNFLIFKSKEIVWQLPYLYGTTEITADNFLNYPDNFVWRDDTIVDSMIDKDISITFDENYSYAWFACPQKWGTPTFTHIDSGLIHPWVPGNYSGTITVTINDTIVVYSVYRSKQEYWSGNGSNAQEIKWHVS